MAETPEEVLEVAKHTLAMERDRQQAVYEHNLEENRAHYAERRALAEVGAAYANSVFRSLLVLNGGAAIALLTFIGNVLNKRPESEQRLSHASTVSIRLFVWGMIFATLTAAASYLSQASFVELKGKTASWTGNAFRGAAVIFAVLSLTAFGWGAIGAATAMKGVG